MFCHVMRNMAYSRGLEKDHPSHELSYIRNEMTFHSLRHRFEQS